MAVEETRFNLKLLVDRKSQKVLFAESGKDFADFLLSFLTLPLGSVIKLLSPRIMVGSIRKLYESVENLNETYLVANRNKSSLLQPSIVSITGVSPLRLCADAKAEVKYYLCGYCRKKASSTWNIKCPTCKIVMINAVDIVMPSESANSSAAAAVSEGNEGGFVKGVATYMITDDLEVTPMSVISSIKSTIHFSTEKDNVQLEEKSVAVGMKEGLTLLETSLESITALTDVFLSMPKKSKSPANICSQLLFDVIGSICPPLLFCSVIVFVVGSFCCMM